MDFLYKYVILFLLEEPMYHYLILMAKMFIITLSASCEKRPICCLLTYSLDDVLLLWGNSLDKSYQIEKYIIM